MWDLHVDNFFGYMTIKMMVHLILIILSQGMQWCHRWWCWHHAMPIPAPMLSHDKKSHVSPHFNCFDLRKAVVPLTTLGIMCCHHWWQLCQWTKKFMLHFFSIVLISGLLLMIPLVSYDSDVNVSDIMTKNVMLHFTLHTASCLNLRTAVMPLMMLLAAYNTDASANDIKVPQSHVRPHFSCLDLRNAMMHLMTLISITWCQGWCQ